MSSRHRIPRWTAAIAWIAAATACRNPVDPRACPQTYEFGNSGCFEVVGQVVGSQGQPLSGVYVGPRPARTAGALASDYRRTDGTGRFQVRATRMTGRPPAEGPDTLSVWVIASDVRYDVVGNPAFIKDSVFTTVMMAPVGAVPPTSEVRIILPEP